MEKKIKVLVVYTNEEVLQVIHNLTQAMNIELRSSVPAEAKNALKENNIDFVLMDSKIENPEYDALLKELLIAYPGLFIAMMTDEPSDPKVANSLKLGAKLGLIRPFKKDDIAVAAQAAESSVFYARELNSLEQKLSLAQGEEKEKLAGKIERLKMVVEDIKETHEKRSHRHRSPLPRG